MYMPAIAVNLTANVDGGVIPENKYSSAVAAGSLLTLLNAKG